MNVFVPIWLVVVVSVAAVLLAIAIGVLVVFSQAMSDKS